MELSGRYRLHASREAVWAALSDPAVLRECIPGCQSLQKLSATEARAVVAIEIGAFRSTFTGVVRVGAADPPVSFGLSGEGRGRPAGSAKGSVSATMAQSGKETEVSYSGTAEIGGKLADLGAGIVSAKAQAMSDQFFAALSRQLGGRGRDWVDQLDHSPAAVQLGDEPTEDVVMDKHESAGNYAEKLEHNVQLAAGQNLWGGPAVWCMLAIVVLIAFLALLYGTG